MCNPIDLSIESGHVHSLNPSSKTLLIQASDGAILKWQDFSIESDELTRFIQPSKDAWVLNKVTGSDISKIMGKLESNGQVMLLNPNGILIGKDAFIEVGGLIATSIEGAHWEKGGCKPKGDVINHGTIQSTCGDVVLVGREVRNDGKIEILLKTGNDALIRTGDHWDHVKAHENPYGFAINCTTEDAQCVVSEGGRIILKSDETTLVRGALYGSKVSLFSEGLTVFEGYASVDEGAMEISGRNGFIHNGVIKRHGGVLLLDPEADVTISQKVNYNHEGTYSPTADIVNISISKLIEEIEKGPVTITTAYEGEGGGFGSINVKCDVNHCYSSPYPLQLLSSGWGGINMEGSLTNNGSGAIELKATLGEISILNTLEAADVRIDGERIHVQGEVFGERVNFLGEKGINIEGLVQADGGDLSFKSRAGIVIQKGAVSNVGTGKLTLEGMNSLPLQGVHLLESGTIFTSCYSKGIFLNTVEGRVLLEEGSIIGHHAPIHICGKGSIELLNSTLTTHGPISLDMGGHLFIDSSQLNTVSPMSITLGGDLLLTGESILSSPGSMTVNAKGDITLVESAAIKGRGISIVGGESLSLFMNAKVDGGMGPVIISAAKDILLEEGAPHISGGQLQVHAGHHVIMESYASLVSHEGAATITAGKEIHLTDAACMFAFGGDLNVIASQGTIHMFGTSSLSAKTHNAAVIAGHCLAMENFSHIDSMGEGGTTIVVDHQNTGGGLIMTPRSYMTTGEAPLRLFTAKRSLNSIEGKLNGHHLTQAPLYLNTTTERWGMEYPSTFSAQPFTLFHKENGLIHLVPGGATHETFNRMLINFIGPYTAELFRELHPYDEYIKNIVNFKDNGIKYWIRRRALGEKGEIL